MGSTVPGARDSFTASNSAGASIIPQQTRQHAHAAHRGWNLDQDWIDRAHRRKAYDTDPVAQQNYVHAVWPTPKLQTAPDRSLVASAPEVRGLETGRAVAYPPNSRYWLIRQCHERAFPLRFPRAVRWLYACSCSPTIRSSLIESRTCDDTVATFK